MADPTLADKGAAHRPGAPARVLPRGVRTYHPRRGRLTPDKRTRLAVLLDRHGVPAAGRLDLAALFAGRPVVLEIGFGMGEATIAMAAADPATAILAADIHTPGALALLTAVEREGLANVRVAHADALDLLADQLPADSLAGVRVFFPDPWPKARHRKRRLVQAPVMSLVASRVRPGGFVHLATDVSDYASDMLTVVTQEPLLCNDYPGFAPRPCHRPLTRYELRGRDLDNRVYDLLLHRAAG
jgi:tRNA (guanine-N7-)-methyltransferase